MKTLLNEFIFIGCTMRLARFKKLVPLVSLLSVFGISSCGKQPASHKISYFIFEERAGFEEYSLQKTNGQITYSSKIQSNYFRTVDKTLIIEANLHSKISSFSVSGNTYPWFENFRKMVQKGDDMISAVYEPLPVSQLALIISQFKKNESTKNFRITYHGIRSIKGINESLECYSLDDLTWGKCFVWIGADGLVNAAVCPLVAFTLYALDSRFENAKDELEKEYAILSFTHFQNQIGSIAVSKTVAINNVKIWDGLSDSITSGQTIVFSDNGIIFIGQKPPSSLKIDTLINGSGKTVLPGLWDMHAHLKQIEWLPAYLGAGITTLRDMGNSFEYITSLSRLANSGNSISPYIFKAGFIDAKGSRLYTGLQANTPEEGRELVNRYAAAGFDEIKIWNNLQPPVFSAIVKEAKKKGLPIVGHIPAALNYRSAIDQGQGQISHISHLVSANETPATAFNEDKIILYLKSNYVTIEPTLVVEEIGWRNKNEPLWKIEPSAKYAETHVLRLWSALGTDKKTSESAGVAYLKRTFSFVKKLHDAGVPIIAGSDQGIPGYTLLRELELFVEAGLSPLDALKTATINPAKIMNRQNDVVLRKGDLRDFIVVNGNPFENISDLRKVELTFVNGHLITTQPLLKMAGYSLPD